MTTDVRKATPNPGSDAALDAGCTCAVLDNGHGRGYLGGVKDPETGETMFVMTASCPLHGAGQTDTKYSLFPV